MSFYYTHTSYPIYGTQSNSTLDKSEWTRVQAGFDKIQNPTGYGGYVLKCATDESGLVASGVAISDANVMTGLAGLTSTGAVNLTGATVTLQTPASGDNSTKAATTQFVASFAFSPSLVGTANQLVRVNAAGTAYEGSLIGTAGQFLRVNQAGTALEGAVALSAFQTTAIAQSSYIFNGGL